ncbi:MAG: ABC transporter permease [Bacteroidia bacterium]|nr:ABC transporter permease [Bacteroidia bacterium]
MKSDTDWTLDVKPQSKGIDLNMKELWRYKDLLFLLVKRDFVSVYKQTILGPFWFFVQPIITSLTFTIIFGRIAGLGSDGIPSMLFYLSGLTLWTYFSDCLNKTSGTFISNASIFGKVYFPRLIIPLSVLISNLIKLAIQLVLFLVVWVYYLITQDVVHPHYELIIVFPLLVIIMALMGMGIGILISSLTTKYRDLTFLVGFGVQLIMYLSPIIYPMSKVEGKFKLLIMANPITHVIEAFKYIFLGTGSLNWLYLGYSFLFMLVILFIGVFSFGKVEKNFMDTV